MIEELLILIASKLNCILVFLTFLKILSDFFWTSYDLLSFRKINNPSQFILTPPLVYLALRSTNIYSHPNYLIFYINTSLESLTDIAAERVCIF